MPRRRLISCAILQVLIAITIIDLACLFEAFQRFAPPRALYVIFLALRGALLSASLSASFLPVITTQYSPAHINAVASSTRHRFIPRADAHFLSRKFSCLYYGVADAEISSFTKVRRSPLCL